MTKVTKQCRICGKTYTPCGYCEGDKMAFHYRAICCSRECAKVYLARVLEARGISSQSEHEGKAQPDISKKTDNDDIETNTTDVHATVVKRKKRKRNLETLDQEITPDNTIESEDM